MQIVLEQGIDLAIADHQLQIIAGQQLAEHCANNSCDIIFIADIALADLLRAQGGLLSWIPIVGVNLTDLEANNANIDYLLDQANNPAQLPVILHAALRQHDFRTQACTIAHELMLENHELESLVSSDQLTGFANASSFEDLLEEQWFKSKRDLNALGLILLDIDYFQKFNQIYGIEKSDEAIKKIALAISQALPNYKKLIARTAKANFAVLLPDVTQEKTQQLAEKIHNAIDILKIPHDGSGCNIYLTASLGAATTNTDAMQTPWDLVDAADYAVYKAKHAGRNKVYCS
ncbi:MAG: hypothetical protein COB50_02640 [Thiotrichales bacterium]|nr:MAG: hypothetical protein COB50_02640 [Thiotrichales bacterium]